MAVVTPAQSSFNGGEISPRLRQRFDQNIRTIAVKAMSGWFPLLQGPAEACPGTIFVAAAKGPFRAIPYEFNVTQSYVIEAGNAYARFYTNDVRIETSPGTAYEITTPWTLDQVRRLTYHQALDVMYAAVREVPLQQIFRTSADTFAIDALELMNGPFEARNGDKTLTVTASTVLGAITITASAPIFEEGDVGGLMEIEGGEFDSIVSWESGMEVTTSMVVQANGNVYQRVGGELRTGQNVPIHTEGAAFDGIRGKDVADKGPYGVQWRYQYNRWGLVKFTGFVSSTEMTANVLTRLPTSQPCWRWRFGAFSTRRGFPEAVGVWQERLVLGKDRTLHLSVAGDLPNFALRNEFGDVTRDMAFSIDLDDASPIRWILGGDLALVVGTATKEHIVVQASQGSGAGPGNTDTANPKTRGSAAIRPLLIDSRAIFVQRARNKLMQFAYDTNQLLRVESANLSRFADHIGAAGLGELAWCPEPERLLWSVLDDGRLAVCAYDPDEELLGWATRTLGDGMLARTIASVTDPDGRLPQLWIGAETNGQHWMLRMAPIRRTGDTDEQIMVDSAVRRTGAPSTAISAPHLANRTVDICADGRPIMGVVLNGSGAATIDFAASDVITGLRFPAEITFLPPISGSENGPAYGKQKRASRIDLELINSDTLEVAVQGSIDRVNLIKRATALDATNPLASGRQRVEPRGDIDGEMEITVRRIYPRPSTLSVIVPHFESAQA